MGATVGCVDVGGQSPVSERARLGNDIARLSRRQSRVSRVSDLQGLRDGI